VFPDKHGAVGGLGDVGNTTGGADYSLSTAIGLFNSAINLILLVIVNYISGKVSENSLW